MSQFKFSFKLLSLITAISHKFPYFSQDNNFDNQLKTVYEKDSDYLDLSVKQSLIPNAGLGLFAKKDFKNEELIAEFRGLVINSLFHTDKVFDSEKSMVYINEKYCILCRSLARFANDCVKFPSKLTKEEYENNYKDNNMPLHDNCIHNAKIEIIGNKAFLKAINNIKNGEEIYVSYGRFYWDFYLKEKLEINEG